MIEVVSETYYTSTSSPISQSFDATGANFLVAFAFYEGGTTVDTPTYDGVSLTLQLTATALDNEAIVKVFTLASPSTGSNTFSLAFSAAAGVEVVALSGVDISDAVEGTGTDASDDVIGTPDASMQVDISEASTIPSILIQSGIGHWSGGSTWEPNSDETLILNQNDSNLSGYQVGAQYKAFTGSGTKTTIFNHLQLGGDFQFNVSGGILLNGVPQAPPQILTYE